LHATVTEYSFTLSPLEDIHLLEKDWIELESKSNCHFFLSWLWISTWIETYQPVLKIIRAYYEDEIVAIAALVLNKQRRHWLLNSRTLHLNQTGNPEKDQIWIEYNGFLAKEGHIKNVTTSGIKFLVDSLDSWDEIIIGAITDQQATMLEHGGNLMRYDLWHAPCYGVDLNAIRFKNSNYLSTLSRNTRYQIQRSIKLYEQSGSLTIETADCENSAIQYFNEIGPLHIARWGYGYGESGYTNPHFKLFHRNLIRKCWDRGAVDLLRIKIAEKTIARFYNFIYRKRVYFYLSGLVSEDNGKLKPGLTGHSLCIQKYINEGQDFYDFMGGSERYKKNLANKHQELVKVTLQKRKFKFLLERTARKIKNILPTK
jgi:CelD/BcsL family acetyltransferase involved in cellulose biosynthesis